MRHRADVRPHALGQDLPLVYHDALQQCGVGALRHRQIAVAAHTERDGALVGRVTTDALVPEGAQDLSVGRVVPRPAAMALPLLLRAQHGLVVRSTHHDAVLVGQPRVQRVVLVEGVGPHRRPEVVALEPEDQLKDLRVELAVVVAELLLDPARERGRLVVQKDAAVLHSRRALDVRARLHVQGAPPLDRHIGPPVPGRYADLLGQVVDAVDRAALVAAGDHQRAGDTGQRLRHHLDHEGFPLALDDLDVELAFLGESIDDSAFAQGADKDRVRARAVLGLREPWYAAGHALDVGLQVLCSAHHAWPLVPVDVDVGERLSSRDDEAGRSGCKLDVALLANGKGLWRQKQRTKKRAQCACASDPIRCSPQRAPAASSANAHSTDTGHDDHWAVPWTFLAIVPRGSRAVPAPPWSAILACLARPIPRDASSGPVHTGPDRWSGPGRLLPHQPRMCSEAGRGQAAVKGVRSVWN